MHVPLKLNLCVGRRKLEKTPREEIIRGTGTISTGSKAATLVLIDGIEGNMNNLNPDDVESISVLKRCSRQFYLWFTCSIRRDFDYY